MPRPLPARRPLVGGRAAVALMALAATSLLLTSAASAQGRKLWTEGAVDTGIRPDSPVTFDAFSKLARKAAPAVVAVETEIRQAAGSRSFFGPFFPERRGQGAGSGFIIHPDGYMLSNNHVVEGARKITVHLKDGRHFEAEVVGTDPATDVALVKIQNNGEKLPVVPLGNSERLDIGEWVVAIGNPLGLSHTVTAGIVSAKGRREVRPDGRLRYANFIQTDASINPGNSGGPLFNTRGEVVGINTAISAQGQGIGFAIPINMVKKLIPDLAADGEVHRSWIGIEIQAVTEPLAQAFGLGQPRGALVAGVASKSPAEAAGLKSGDIIVGFDGKPIQRHDDLPWLASTAGVGRTVQLDVVRAEERMKLALTLAAMPGSNREVSMSRGERRGRRKVKGLEHMGVTFESLPPRLAREMEVEEGVLVGQVDPGSVPGEAGLQRGDIVVRANGRSVDSPKALVRIIEKADDGSMMRFLVVRRGRKVFLAFTK